MRCTNPVRIKGPAGPLTVGCGKCLSCRIGQKAEWAMRLNHEFLYWNFKGSFWTLTYRDDIERPIFSLSKRHLQLFFKRLRKSGSRVRYFACGEYGDRTSRPHYHSIIFGLDSSEFPGLDSRGELIRFHHPAWEHGHVTVGSVTPESIRYVTGYISKKYSGDLENEVYTKTGRENVFRVLSNGIGERWILDNKRDVLAKGYVSYEGRKCSIPRYYLKVMNIDELDILKLRKGAREREIEQNERRFLLYTTFDELYEGFINKAIDSDTYEYYINEKFKYDTQKALNLEKKFEYLSRKRKRSI